jgi:hypothetical protein
MGILHRALIEKNATILLQSGTGAKSQNCRHLIVALR